MCVPQACVDSEEDGIWVEPTVVVVDIYRMHLILRRGGQFGGATVLECRVPVYTNT